MASTRLDDVRQTENGSPTVSVVETIAEIEGTDPRHLPPLSERLDPDALDALCRSLADGRVTFEYCGYTVTVYDSGTIDVEV